jgi:oxygen-independent coproporphyrinogen-3 oxidase
MAAPGIGVYLHWPFCAAKCPYCDFNSHVAARVDQARWTRAFLAEIDRVAADLGPRRIETVFFGGGTPSLMEPGVVQAILERLAMRWDLADGAEITLEANPSSVEGARFKGYQAAGVNRLSLGVQALDDGDLRRLGRLHGVAAALDGLEIARSTFDRVSFDLIYARQDQSLASWEAELRRALDFAPTHLSLYQLTIEDGTAFGQRHRAGGLRGLPDDDLAADMFALTQQMTTQAGLPAYEVSNHAAPGQEGRHNLIYWRGGEYAGIGPGAHGRVNRNGTRLATETHLAPEVWLQAVENGGGGESRVVALDPDDVARERVLMGLRLAEGLPVESVPDVWRAGVTAKARGLAELGLMSVDGHRITVTPAGMPVLNAVIAEVLRDY